MKRYEEIYDLDGNVLFLDEIDDEEEDTLKAIETVIGIIVGILMVIVAIAQIVKMG